MNIDLHQCLLNSSKGKILLEFHWVCHLTLVKLFVASCLNMSYSCYLYVTFLILYVDAALDYRKQRLNWKFNKIDINKDDQLNKEFELYHFMLEIKHFVKSREVYDTIFVLIDEDDDKLISKSEWLAFFDNISTTPDGSKLQLDCLILVMYGRSCNY